MRCHKVQGMTEAFFDSIILGKLICCLAREKRLFGELNCSFCTAIQRIRKSFRHALHLVTAHLHRQNQVAHSLRTRDFWLASLSMHFPIHFARRAHEYPVTLINKLIGLITTFYIRSTFHSMFHSTFHSIPRSAFYTQP